MTWWMYALLSAAAASATAVFAKLGVKEIPSNLATAIRTAIVLVFASAIVVARNEHGALRELDRKSLLFLLLSGIGTGISWLAYFKALQMAPASQVAPIDKLSLALTLVFAAVFLGEQISWRVAAGALLIVAGALLTISETPAR